MSPGIVYLAFTVAPAAFLAVAAVIAIIQEVLESKKHREEHHGVHHDR